MSDGQARVARANGYWFLKLGGDLRHPLGPALNALLDRAFAGPDYAGFLIDLSDAENIDSTCLGILARIGIRAQQTGAARPSILGAGADLREVLEAVCFDRIFTLAAADGTVAQGQEPLPELAAEEGPLLALVLEAHRRLCDLDARNQDAFRDLIEVLERDALGRGGSGG
jgi:anti-anti-sigma regulatory factor